VKKAKAVLSAGLCSRCCRAYLRPDNLVHLERTASRNSWTELKSVGIFRNPGGSRTESGPCGPHPGMKTHIRLPRCGKRDGRSQARVDWCACCPFYTTHSTLPQRTTSGGWL